MSKSSEHQAAFDKIRELRAQALEHASEARRLSAERSVLMQRLLDDGLSRADIARELGVTRQAVQKMLAAQ
jgi:DNA-binding NarL/FixJ family response regulator